MVTVFSRGEDRGTLNQRQLLERELDGLFADLSGLGEVSYCLKMRTAILAASTVLASLGGDGGGKHRDLLEAGIIAAQDANERPLVKLLKTILPRL